MTSEIQCLAGLTAQAEDTVVWPPYQFRVSTYLSANWPPLALITSVRAVVWQGGQVLVVRDQNNTHILPGGQREADETLLQTLHREVLEETGWHLRAWQPLGFVHFQHLSAPPAHTNNLFPYPDFFQVVYRATAEDYEAARRVSGGRELGAVFCPLAEVAALPLAQGERVLLGGGPPAPTNN